MTTRIEGTLLVTEGFKDDATGATYQAGDRAPLHYRSVRQHALEHPEAFRVEFATEPLDLDWLREIHEIHEANYVRTRQSMAAREGEAMRAEWAAQEESKRRSGSLEKRYREQEKRDKERLAAMKDELERQRYERLVMHR
jgi:hypothetical protein